MKTEEIYDKTSFSDGAHPPYRQPYKKSKIKLIAVIVIAFIVIAGLIFAGLTAYWYNRHKFVCNVDSISVYQFEGNENFYRFEINGTINTWFFDFNTYRNYTFDGGEGGGAVQYSNTCASSSRFNIGKTATEFTAYVDVDTSSYNWGDGIPDYIYERRFYLADSSGKVTNNGDTVLFMNDFRNVKIEQKQPQKVADSKLYDNK